MSETYLPRQRPVGGKVPTLAHIMHVANPTVFPAKPKPEPKPHSVPRMSLGLDKPVRDVPLEVVRVSQADVQNLAAWGEKKFLDRFPMASVEMLEAYLRHACARNDYGAFRTVQAWGICQIRKHPLDPKPWSELMFLVTKSPVHDEVMALLRQMMNWSRSMGASEFRFTPYSDYPLESILLKLSVSDSDQIYYTVL